jgi:hypothetical protein
VHSDKMIMVPVHDFSSFLSRWMRELVGSSPL